MIAIVPMMEEHIDGVVAVEEGTFSIPWTRADFEREVRENNMAIYFVAVEDGKVVGYAEITDKSLLRHALPSIGSSIV